MRLNKTERAPVEFVDEDIGHAHTGFSSVPTAVISAELT